MFHKAYSGTIYGINGMIIQVEADVSEGLPMFDMVGFLASEVKEAKERVKIAIRNSGYHLLPKRITINLSPADVKKSGTAFDLPIAVAILASFGYLPQNCLERILIIGELSLDGTINCVNGVLPIVSAAKEAGFQTCLVPKENIIEGAIIEGIDVIGVSCLKEVIFYLNGKLQLEKGYVNLEQLKNNNSENMELDFKDITGQESIKRAIEVGVAGQHNILMIGPPGAGKTMLAKRIPTIMPDLTLQESLSISKIYSVAGLLNSTQSFIVTRPFRSPHHTITATALVGGGKNPKAGEITLASGGVLFLDELTEFPKNILELLRQPLEDKEIKIVRLQMACTYPAQFMLVAAMNPCKCGYFPNRNQCNCSLPEVKKYIGKISAPFLDRIDICTEAVKVEYKQLVQVERAETSKTIRERITKVREIQLNRFQQGKERIHFNGEMTSNMIQKFCYLGLQEIQFLEMAYNKLQLTARGYYRILKVARTIADLEESENIKKKHLAEALNYRMLDQKYWGI